MMGSQGIHERIKGQGQDPSGRSTLPLLWGSGLRHQLYMRRVVGCRRGKDLPLGSTLVFKTCGRWVFGQLRASKKKVRSMLTSLSLNSAGNVPFSHLSRSHGPWGLELGQPYNGKILGEEIWTQKCLGRSSVRGCGSSWDLPKTYICIERIQFMAFMEMPCPQDPWNTHWNCQ